MQGLRFIFLTTDLFDQLRQQMNYNIRDRTNRYTIGNAVAKGHRQKTEVGRNGGYQVNLEDVSQRAHHQKADINQSRRGSKARNRRKYRRKEHCQEKESASCN